MNGIVRAKNVTSLDCSYSLLALKEINLVLKTPFLHLKRRVFNWKYIYHLCNLKNVKKTWVNATFNTTKSNTPPWVFFTFLKIVQMAPGHAKHHIYIHVDASPLFTFDPMEGVAQ